MQEELIIYGQSIKPGEHKLIHLDIARLPTGTLIDIPVHVFRGKEKGPSLLIQGGMHGDELNGVEILRRMLNNDELKIQRGNLIVIPLLNIFGFLHFSRDVPNGKDVNRSFPGNKSGSLASRVVWYFMKEIFPHVEMAIDLHTGGGSRFNYPQIRYSPKSTHGKDLAKVFAAPFMLPSGLIDKSFRKTAEKKGVPVIVYEAGESGRFDENAIEEGLKGIYRVLDHLGMTSGMSRPPSSQPIELSSGSWLRARSSGMFNPTVKMGEYVMKGHPIGSISVPYNTYHHKIKAHKEGHVICINHSPVVSQGEALIRVGIPV